MEKDEEPQFELKDNVRRKIIKQSELYDILKNMLEIPEKETPPIAIRLLNKENMHNLEHKHWEGNDQCFGPSTGMVRYAAFPTYNDDQLLLLEAGWFEHTEKTKKDQ